MSGSLTAEQLARVAELEARKAAGRGRITDAEFIELEGLRDLARSLTGPAELADDPRTLADEARRPLLTGSDDPSTPEDESDALGLFKSREAREREAWLREAWATLWRALGPLVVQFGQAAIGAALAKVPHDVLIPGLVTLDLSPVLKAVETVARDGLRDVTSRP